MASVHPYLNFNGNCEEAFNFYKSVFGGDFAYVGRFGEMPPMEGQELSEEDKNKIMHISLPMSDGTILMGSDSGGDWGPSLIVGNNITLSLNASNKENADEMYQNLSAGGEQSMPLQQQFWGDYFGMLTDKFGINWMISFNAEQQSK